MQRQTLHEMSGLSAEEATRRLLTMLETQLQQETGTILLRHQRQLAETCEEKTREVLLTCLHRYAASHTAESTTSSVDIPNDEMKGRIIGREGRNIRAFEKATGVDVIIDDTPGVVIVSAFDNIRREVARLALSKLIADGRIHPSRIEEIVADTQTELERHIQKVGEQACQEVDVHGLHERLVNLLGRLHFRTSYSQNVLRHSIEVAFLAGMMADEMGLDGALARRCGLLHDIGKAADHETEGGHPKIGAELLKRYGERAEVVHAAASAITTICVDNPYTVLVAAADAASAGRPGARRETLERYVKRMEELESIATGFPGVEQAYRHPGRPRAAGDRQLQADHRRKRRQDLPRHRQGLRRAADLPRRDQGHRAPRSRATPNWLANFGFWIMDLDSRFGSLILGLETQSKVQIQDRKSVERPHPVRLFLIGDVVGKPGRQIVLKALPGTADRGAPRLRRGQRRERGRRLGAHPAHLP